MSGGQTPPIDPVAYWNETAGQKWAAYQRELDQTLGPLGLSTIAVAEPITGERVLDVGCGCGDTVLELAKRVGAHGRVIGLDVSQPMLAVARARIGDDPRIELIEEDAARYAPDQPIDLIFSRFGVMFFADTVAAFANLRQVLRPGGRIAFLAWRELEVNHWMSAARKAAENILPPFPPTDTDAPGPFFFADSAKIERVLTEAGWVNIEIRAHDEAVILADGDLEHATELSMRIGPTAAALAEATKEARAEVRAALRARLATYLENGKVRIPTATWIVTANRKT